MSDQNKKPALTITRNTVRTSIRAGADEGAGPRPIRGPVFTTTVHGYTVDMCL